MSLSSKYKEIAASMIALGGMILISACTSPTLDQGLNESQALRSCYAAIRDKQIQTIEDCGNYVSFHASLYTEIDQSNAAHAACAFARYSLDYVRTYYQHNKNLLNRLGKQVATDCSKQNGGKYKNHLPLMPSSTANPL